MSERKDSTSSKSDDRLARLEAVTDAALARLDLEELMGELLERVRDSLEVDTAAVLILDEAQGDLVATAARGLEEEVLQGVRIRLGAGFAGRIAAQKSAVILDRVDHTTVRNPILWEKGIQSLLGVPLLVEGDVVGVLHVGTLHPRAFTGEDAEFLQLVADRLALAVRSRLSARERAATLALQRSLLPTKLPDIPGLALATRYVPGGAGEVGGDWYDLFTLTSGHVCVAIGDVAGHGLRSAVIMGRLRSALRAYAIESIDPAEVLRRTNRKLQHFEPDELATAQYAVFEPSLERFTISSAGHPPPVMMAPGEGTVVLDFVPDPPLGVPFDSERRAETIEFPRGAMVCFYTDGLVERRDQPLDSGFARLQAAMVGTDAEGLCSTVMSRMVGSEPVSDDIAVLVIERQ
ncbi:MAG: SpoIIE family protein phosphatase [Acidimicrobiia bacterium]|nr:SpoIIE family protein phosphatase [Acidimicrobiia bacterium]